MVFIQKLRKGTGFWYISIPKLIRRHLKVSPGGYLAVIPSKGNKVTIQEVGGFFNDKKNRDNTNSND